MVRYYKQIRSLDRRGATIEEVVRAFYPDRTGDWAAILAAGRLYIEDGGQRFALADFQAAAAAAPNPTPSEVRNDVWDW
jgi:hypothetical protein